MLLKYEKSHYSVSEHDLRNQLIKDFKLKTPDIVSYDASLLEGLMHWINENFVESQEFREKYKKFICRNCGKAHDSLKCPGGW